MLWLTTVALLAFICTFAEIFYQEYLEESGASLIVFMQSYRSHSLDLVFEVLGGITAVLYLLASGVVYLCGHTEIGILGTYAGFLGAAVSGTLKMLIKHPRPFWKESGISVVSCPYDWGAPSGHASSGGAAMVVLAYFWLKDGKNLKFKLLALFTSILITAIDRVYLGAHFHFQVLLGYSHSLLIGFFFIQTGQIDTFFSISRDFSSVIKEHCKILVYSVFALIVYSYQTVEFNELWKINYKEKCGKELTSEGVMGKNISEAMYVWIIAGFIMGHFARKREFRPKLSFGLVFVALAMYSSLILYIVILDKIFLQMFPYYIRLLCLCANRYLGGFVVSFILPKFILSIFEEEKKSKGKVY